MKFMSNKALLMTNSCGYSTSHTMFLGWFFFALCFFLIGKHAKIGCTNEWNGSTYLRARWAFVLKTSERERRWNIVFRLGSGSELCVAALSVSPWLCAAHCTDWICFWTGCETNPDRVPTCSLSIVIDKQPSELKHSFTHSRTHVHPRSLYAMIWSQWGEKISEHASWGRLFLPWKPASPLSAWLICFP